MPPKRVLIKKYENRRLYDTMNSRYVNLDDLAQMVRDGAEIQVVDAVSGEDVTRVVLTQIILEHAKAPDSGFSLELLHQMVLASGKAGKESFLNYMRTMADLYKNTYRAFTPGLPPFDFFQPKSEATPTAAAPQAPVSSLPEQPSIEDLHRRIEELERLVIASAQKSRRTPKPRKGTDGQRRSRK